MLVAAAFILGSAFGSAKNLVSASFAPSVFSSATQR
jgi:hypothetical protein